jgi:hypothetical protein
MAMKASFPVIPLDEILSKSDEWIDLDPVQTYQQATIKSISDWRCWA